ncbi:hypothetical protein ACFS5L_42475 [Streptomyces phyllanthi]|uniref:Uncharacterized protein n=1 Tax=Streptomyces phyllanthi TaxID=1803180 RepID=A0A5N8VYC2_9ACTN|nr:hypothetical protein [Streptomyces phyllanthi]MPY39038.1 hypothetical protein [Streptomyces phyllanthi]
MKVAEVQVFLNYGTLVVGSDSDPDFDLLDSTLPASDAHHVMLPTRAQIAPVRVRVWRGAAPEPARQIFTGDVVLATGYLTMREVLEPPFFLWPTVSAGARVTLSIGTDAWDEATDVTIVVCPTADSLPDVRSRSGFVASVAEISSLGRIDLVLTGHNYPEDRLAAALRILRRASEEEISEARVRYGIATVMEWLKWLHPAISPEALEEVSDKIFRSCLSGHSDGGGAKSLLSYMAAAMGLSVEEFLIGR